MWKFVLMRKKAIIRNNSIILAYCISGHIYITNIICWHILIDIYKKKLAPSVVAQQYVTLLVAHNTQDERGLTNNEDSK